MGDSGASFPTGPFAIKTSESLVLERSLSLLSIYYIYAKLSNEVCRKLKDIKQNVTGW